MSDQPQDHGDHSHVHPTPAGGVEATHDPHGHDDGAGHAHGRAGSSGPSPGVLAPQLPIRQRLAWAVRMWAMAPVSAVA